jgi:hypothetical protein
MNLLNQEQIEKLKARNWEVVPDGAYINLHRYDFDKDKYWEEICEQLDISKDLDAITILYVAKKLPEIMIL